MITSKEAAINTILSHEGEFAEVKNPSYVYPPVEYYPLAPPVKSVKQLKAALMDMDGTTTTTEVLCVYSLEMMVRRMSGRYSHDQWKGVDHGHDLPHIIGNSTTRHVEYLLNTYREMLDEETIAREFLIAARWTLANSHDLQRRAEVMQNLKKLNLDDAPGLIDGGVSEEEWLKRFSYRLSASNFSTRVSLGIDIYYETYHRMLAMLKAGKSAEVRSMVFGGVHSGENLISPMPGISFLIPLLKGWLGEEADLMADILFSDYEKSMGKVLGFSRKQELIDKILKMGKAFEKQPVKLGLVTSSIFYEADIVIREVLEVLKIDIERSRLGAARKEKIRHAYDDYHRVYDAFVTASDSSEIRLKPHRDLYSIALHMAGMIPDDFDKVIGFEDSQSGTVAIRAAGIGCSIAVPFAQTIGHNLEAAAHVLPGGVPQAIIDYELFIKE